MKKTGFLNRFPLAVPLGICNFIVILLSFVLMLNKHYSPDSFNEMAAGSMLSWQILNGRFVFGYVQHTAHNLGLSLSTYSQFYTAVFMGLCAWCATRLTLFFIKHLSQKPGIPALIAINLAVLAAFINVIIWEWYAFPDAMMMYGISLLCAVEAGLAWQHVSEGFPIWKASLISFLLFFLSINSYQASLAWYVAIGCMVILLPNKFQLNKRTFLACICVLAIGAFHSLLNQYLVKVFVELGICSAPSRHMSLSLEMLLNNLPRIWNFQKRIWIEGYNQLPEFFLLIMLVLTTVLYVSAVYRKYGLGGGTVAVLLLAGTMLMVFMPHLVSTDVWITPRTVTGIGIFFAFALAMAVLNGTVKEQLAAVVLTVVFLGFNLFGIYDIGASHLKNNALDQAEVCEIIGWMNAYEEESGATVDTICLLSDAHTSWVRPGITANMDTNNRECMNDWSVGPFFWWATNGRHFSVRNATPEEQEIIVGDQDWEELLVEEQILFDNNVMYYIRY